MANKIFCYANLSNILINSGETELRRFITSSLRTTTEDDIEEFQRLNKKIDRFIFGHAERYKKKCKHNLAQFTKNYATWLEQTFVGVTDEEIINEDVAIESTHEKPFSECCKTGKRNRCEILRNQADSGTVQHLFIDNLRKSDRKIDASIVEKLGEASPLVKIRILQLLSNQEPEIVAYTPDEALALMIELKLTKDRYHEMRMGAKSHKANIYPSYHKIIEAKKRCYPLSISISYIGAEIELQALLNHTASRLIQTCHLYVKEGQSELKLKLIAKWGMDGLSGQSLYKQIFPTTDTDDSDTLPTKSDDFSVFLIAMVPLQLKSLTDDEVIWYNPRPSSTRLCRPIKFEFIKESEVVTNQQYQKIRSQIARLLPFKIIKNKSLTVEITYELELTMIDGKTLNYISYNSSQQTCNICGATPSQMNDLNRIKKKICQVDRYDFGLSTLHCWIRFLECILHIAYRLRFKKWKATGEDKLIVEETKRKIQAKYRTEKGLLLDVVRQGTGSSNDGNTARRFFKDVEFAAETTGVDENLIRRFRVILITLCSGKNVDDRKFQKYSFETAKLFVSLYNWYCMPASVHKVLIHGSDVIRTLNLPIGVYSEEAQEARNKEFKWIREHNTRKTSQLSTNEDLMHGLLVSSDPVISNLRKEKVKEHTELDPEVLDLLSQN